jgi:short-subunit dehydrogenase
MMTPKEKHGPVALIAGASEGLGAAYAHALSARGWNLVLVARRMGPLGTLALDLSARYQIRVQTIACDLGKDDAAERIYQDLENKSVGCLVYNAAASHIGPFLNHSVSDHLYLAQVNMLTPLKMIHLFAPSMLEAKKGSIILMSSLAGFQGSGYLSSYGASKAFNRVLAESLWYEWKKKGVDVIACCAGATATPNYLRTNPSKTSWFAPKPQTPARVVEACLERLGKSPSFVSGRANRVVSFLMQGVFSRKMAINLMGDTTQKMYNIKD